MPTPAGWPGDRAPRFRDLRDTDATDWSHTTRGLLNHDDIVYRYRAWPLLRPLYLLYVLCTRALYTFSSYGVGASQTEPVPRWEPAPLCFWRQPSLPPPPPQLFPSPRSPPPGPPPPSKARRLSNNTIWLLRLICP